MEKLHWCRLVKFFYYKGAFGAAEVSWPDGLTGGRIVARSKSKF